MSILNRPGSLNHAVLFGASNSRRIGATKSSGMRALRKGQAGLFALHDGIVGEARLVERVFGLGPCALTEVMVLLQDRLASAET